MPESPTSLTQPPKEPVIYTIPDQFYGMAAKAQLPKMAAEPAPAPAMPGAPPAAPAPAKQQGEQSKKWLLIPILALLFLALLGFAAWWFLQPKAAAPAPAAPSVTLPTPEPTPQPEPEPTPAPEPEPTPVVETPAAPAPEADADGDGLTNAEEAMYGTNLNNSDSDADGFSDSVEVTNLYNPAGFKPTKLIEAGLVKPYDGAGFELLFPSAWSPVEDGADGRLVSFVADANETMSLDLQENPENQSSLDWFMSRNPGASPSQLQAFTTKSGLDGVRDPLHSTAYIALGGKTYVFTDAAVDPAKRSFGASFTMMINSFSKKP